MKEAKEWMRKAEKDLRTAKVNLDNKEYEAAAFFSHQAAEKALKALYIVKFGRLWKTHDLVGLLAELRGAVELMGICEELNPHYIETRYPTDARYTKPVSVGAIKNAEKVIAWTKKMVLG